MCAMCSARNPKPRTNRSRSTGRSSVRSFWPRRRTTSRSPRSSSCQPACRDGASGAAGEELFGDLRHDGTPRAIVPCQAIVVDRLQSVQMIRRQIGTTARPAGVGACRCHVPLAPGRPSALRDTGAPSLRSTRARSVTVPSPFRCATVRFHATSGVAGLTMRAADGRTGGELRSHLVGAPLAAATKSVLRL